MAVESAISIFSRPLHFNDDFLTLLRDYQHVDLKSGSAFKLGQDIRVHNKKLNPLLKVATANDAKIISELIQEVYEGSYPYKEMEDEKEIRKMIESGKSIFILFMNKQEEIIGSTTFEFDFNAKRCNMRTWVIKKEYHGKFESTKSLIGCCVYIWSLFKDEIFLWYGEVRTAHGKTQYILDLISLKAVGFYPNKDVFFDQVESDILQVSYNKKALKTFRCKKVPVIIPDVEKLYWYSDKKFNLGPYQLSDLDIQLDTTKINDLKNQLKKEISVDKFGYAVIRLKIDHSTSFIEFLYTPAVQNIEKTKYKAENLEELFVLVQGFKKCAYELQVRYYEVFVSAYIAAHQQIFLDAGLSPRGYVPSWDYNKHSCCFEDRILFNQYKGAVDTTLTVYEKNKELLSILEFL